MSHFFASLRVRLALLVLLAVLPALGIILYTGLEQRRQLAANAQDEALILVKHSCADFENVIQTTSQVLALLAQCPSVQLQDWHACAMMLADLLRKHPGYFNLGVVDRHGNLVCSAVPFTGALNMANFAWFMRVRETLDFSLGDLQIGPVIGKPTMHCGYPVLDRDGEMQVAVFAALDLNWLRRLVPMTSLPPGSVFAIIDREGHIMVHYPNPEAWVGKKPRKPRPLRSSWPRGREWRRPRGWTAFPVCTRLPPLELCPTGVGISMWGFPRQRSMPLSPGSWCGISWAWDWPRPWHWPAPWSSATSW